MPGYPTAPGQKRLPLLPSGPDGVRRESAAWDQTFNAVELMQLQGRGNLNVGIQPRYSGLRVKGHR